jgi:hypothetical protein
MRNNSKWTVSSTAETILPQHSNRFHSTVFWICDTHLAELVQFFIRVIYCLLPLVNIDTIKVKICLRSSYIQPNVLVLNEENYNHIHLAGIVKIPNIQCINLMSSKIYLANHRLQYGRLRHLEKLHNDFSNTSRESRFTVKLQVTGNPWWHPPANLSCLRFLAYRN